MKRKCHIFITAAILTELVGNLTANQKNRGLNLATANIKRKLQRENFKKVMSRF